jgi:hypothetical protein
MSTDDEMYRLLDSLEFDPDLPCMASPSNPCSQDAVWYVRCRGCDFPQPRCDAHLNNLRMISSGGLPMQCHKCGWMAPSLDELVVISPIKVRS